MANEGIVINAGVTLFAGACYLTVAAIVHRRRGREAGRVPSAALYFLIVGACLTLAGLRQATAWAGQYSPTLAPVDYWIYLAVVPPAALTIVPLSHLTAFAAWGKPRVANLVAGFFTVVCGVGITLAYAGGFTGPEISYWGSEWRINSAAAKVMLVLFITLPAVAASVLLAYTGSKMRGAPGRKLRLIGWACLIYYAAFTLDALGLDGVPLILARLTTAGAALLGYLAYAGASEEAAPGVTAPA